ncbi:hypothetical protein, conserved [Babesia ovata]|uniref:Uncharacterized protein n=1 Tax=Babesia ovata TaxID=189622 RepID=A0A2H6KHH1_9APIC|nr:uncharacterized protein BOVATA_039310 [Babesia ovata]GBE62438.1 hypothetical protein, conserved [Babesia ovata]
MVYTSLTEAPQNLKEAIDWLIALKGTDAENNMKAFGDAVYKFLADKPVGYTKLPALEKVKVITKEFLEQKELKDMWPASELLGRFNNPMDKKPNVIVRLLRVVDESDYTNIIQTQGVKAEDVAKDLGNVVAGCEKFLDDIKHPDHYESSYSSKATWTKSCAKNPEDCAAVFVGIAPMLYAGLRSLREAGNPNIFGRVTSNADKLLGKVLKAVGYKEEECAAGMGGSDIRNALRGVKFQMLVTLYDLAGFWAFY